MFRGYSDTLFPQNTPKKGNQLSWGLAPDFIFAGWLLWTNTRFAVVSYNLFKWLCICSM